MKYSQWFWFNYIFLVTFLLINTNPESFHIAFSSVVGIGLFFIYGINFSLAINIFWRMGFILWQKLSLGYLFSFFVLPLEVYIISFFAHPMSFFAVQVTVVMSVACLLGILKYLVKNSNELVF